MKNLKLLIIAVLFITAVLFTSSFAQNGDDDGDGIKNSDDLCPASKGTAANKGCPEKTESAGQSKKSNDENQQLGCISGNCVNGEGKFKIAGGDYYEGSFVNKKREGQGTYIWTTGKKYVGSFKNGIMDGYGTFYHENGDIYEGYFVRGLREGKGTFTFFSNGLVHIGEFKEGKRHGAGIVYDKNKNVFQQGIWQNDVFSAQNSPNSTSNKTLSQAELLRLQISMVDEIDAKTARYKQLLQQYSTTMPAKLQKENLDARKSELTAINRIATKALADFGNQLTAESKTYFTQKVSDSDLNLKLVNTSLGLLVLDQKDLDDRTGSASLDKTFPKTKTENVVKNPTDTTPERLNPKNEGKELYDAIEAGNEQLALELIKKGTNLHYLSKEASTLSLAVSKKNIVLVKALLEAGAAPNLKDNNIGATALAGAVRNESVEMIELLLKHKADVNQKMNIGWSVLHTAAFFNDDEKIIKLLLDAGADPNIYSKDGVTPLGVALPRTNKNLANLLSSVSNQEVKNSPDKRPAQPTSAASKAQATAQANAYNERVAISEYNKIHPQIESDMRIYVAAINKYRKAGEAQFLYKGTYATIINTKKRALDTINKFLKEHGKYLPEEMRIHLQEDAAKFVDAPNY